MSKKELLRLIVISIIIVFIILVALFAFSKEYILKHNVVIAKASIKEEEDYIETSSSIIIEDEIELSTPRPIPVQTPEPIIETPTPEPTIIIQTPEPVIETPTPAPQVNENQNYSSNTYYIKVNNQMNTVTVYTKDELGNYTIPVKAMICSIGEATPTNSAYQITYKRWPWRLLFGNVYGQYATQICGDILFHSVPYIKQSKDTLEYWEYDKLGTTASAGCVRLTVEDAKWVYENCLPGTIVEFYFSDNPGELGKPSIETISNNEQCRNWDPTDPDPNNPWRTYQ